MNDLRPKALGQREHAKRRALERYGMEMSDLEIAEVVRKIQRCDSTVVASHSLRVSVHDVNLGGPFGVVRAVYDNKSKEER